MGTQREGHGRTPLMHEPQKSDRPIVPTRAPNKPGPPGTEEPEGRGLAKRNPLEADTYRILGRGSVRSGLERIRQAAQRDKKGQFTSLYHQIYAIDMLWEAYSSLKRDAAPGLDGETWQHYGEDLEANLQDLSRRLRQGAYRAKPVKRAFIPKADGRQRPLGVPVLEDKIVQRATVIVLNAIYESGFFFGFSYGFRAGRSQHDALAALDHGLMTKKVNWVLDADIRGFFEAIEHETLVRLVEHRIGDQRVVRLIQKWLNAGVLADGAWTRQAEGTPQGSSISPLLANIYLHYVFDRWVQQWRKRARGDVVVVRWADDFIVGFQFQAEAEQFLAELTERLREFGLELHPDKTRLLEFGRYAASARQQRGQGKPETFNFLGFTHICGQTRKGKFTVQRQTQKQRLRAKLKEVKAELQRRRQASVAAVGSWLATVVRGHCQYYGVPGNSRALALFRYRIERLWHRALSRRSQKARLTWGRMKRLTKRWLPPTCITHPYFSVRFAVMTQGRSPVR